MTDREELVKDIFLEHQNCMGMDLEEATDIYEDTPFPQIERFLLKQGYEIVV